MKKHILISKNIPQGRITEIFGDVDTGKSTAVLKIIGALANKTCLYIDTDRSLTQQQLAEFDIQDMVTIFQPDTIEQVIDITDQFLEQNVFDIIVFDSTANLISEKNKDLPVDQISWQRKVADITKLVQKLIPVIENRNMIVIFVSQIRKDLKGNSYTTGGKALRFYSTVRLEISRDDITVVKNKTDKVLLRANDYIKQEVS